MFQIPQKIEYIIEKLTQNGFEAYIVGGCVRDILLSKVYSQKSRQTVLTNTLSSSQIQIVRQVGVCDKTRVNLTLALHML